MLAALGAAAEAPTDAAGGGVIAAGGAAAAAGGSAGADAAGAGALPAAGAATKAGGGARPAGGAGAGAACSGATIGPALHASVAQLAGPAHWAGHWYRLRARRMHWHRPAPAAHLLRPTPAGALGRGAAPRAQAARSSGPGLVQGAPPAAHAPGSQHGPIGRLHRPRHPCMAPPTHLGPQWDRWPLPQAPYHRQLAVMNT